jgi:antibiotic biosynthesis monooxygenase
MVQLRDPDEFHIHTRWADMEAFERHVELPHTVRFVGLGRAQMHSHHARQFRRATARREYDFVTVFDALHDIGDPVGASWRVLVALAANGSWMIVEPFAGDRVEENLNPVGRAYYAGSTMICTPCALAQDVGPRARRPRRAKHACERS